MLVAHTVAASATNHRLAVPALARGAVRPVLVSFFDIMAFSDPKALERLLARLDVNHTRRDEPLAPYTTFRIGGPADVFFEATTADALANAVLVAPEIGVTYFVFGAVR